MLIQFLETEMLNSKNININASIDAKQIASFRDLINLVLKIKISEGFIDINETTFSWQNFVDFEILDSALYMSDNNLVLDALITINIKNYNEVYKFFQTPRNDRNEIKKIEFNINYNFDQFTVRLNDIKIDETVNQKINKNLDRIILKDNSLQNKIYLKNLVNQVIKIYAG